jgi:hypothetical protein
VQDLRRLRLSEVGGVTGPGHDRSVRPTPLDRSDATIYSIRRGIVVAEGEYIARQTWIEGSFVRPAVWWSPPVPASSWTS